MYIGIDLGTTNSAIVGNKGAELKIYKTADGADTLPSVIYADKRGHKLYGKRAYDQTLLSSENVAAGFKRLMGTSSKIELKAANLNMSPEECSSEILKILMGQAFTESGENEIEGVVVTIPAAFNQMQSEATIRAAEMAGISQVALLQEPIAAAMAAMAQVKNKSGQFLVYDIGGGTFDLALVQSIAGSINIIAHEGINMLGGRDFDRSIVNQYVRPWLLKNFDLPEDFQKNPKYSRLIGIARLAAEKAKIELSTSESEVIFASDEEVRVKDEAGNDIYLEIELKRSDLEDIIREDIDKTVKLTRKILKDNGYSSEDIDRIVFVGGPTKMPYIRNHVPQELGIPVDLQIDPMTAVALGASIYAESREWDGKTTKRKKSRSSDTVSDKIDLKFDHPSRTSDEKAKVRIKVGESNIDDGFEIQIDSTGGWTSGRKSIAGDNSIEVPLPDMGDNNFRIIVFDKAGKPVKDASKDFTVVRTYASSAGVPATQTISVKVRESSESTRNILSPIIEKGTSLPAKGESKFKATRDLKSGDRDDYFDFELFQDEGAKEPELNLCIGSFRVLGTDLEEGMKIREGDEIVFHWEMSDSGLLKATVDLPSVGQTFDTPKFYVDQAGHQAFDRDGVKIAGSVIRDTEGELNELIELTGQNDTEEVESIKKDLEKQKKNLMMSEDADTTRSVTESSRHIRQAISKIKHAPENKSKVMKKELAELVSGFNQFAREYVDDKTQELFDLNAKHADECLSRASDKDMKDAESHIEAMRGFFMKGLWSNPDFLLDSLRDAAANSHLASDKEKYEALVQKGAEAIKNNDVDELRRVLFMLSDLRISVGGTSSPLDKLASIMRA
ncbi:MAG: Hsp70 family protein [Rhodospirillales bacterium]|nr:Hsp70 family protein [Rhodospirillales bacterium]